jgi:hypothetical protein
MGCCGGSAPDEAFQDLAASLPVTVRTPGEIPSMPFKHHHDRRILGCVISDMDPNFIHRPLHIKGPPLANTTGDYIVHLAVASALCPLGMRLC